MEVLRYIQEHHPATVREVADHFAERKGQVRTTLLNVMERLRRKGFLTRKKVDGVFQYSPRVHREDLLKALVRQFVRRTLGGSVTPFVAYLVRETKLSAEEVQELKRLVAELEASK